MAKCELFGKRAILRARDLRLIYLGRSCPQDAVHGRDSINRTGVRT
jgi:hypothetical protein